MKSKIWCAIFSTAFLGIANFSLAQEPAFSKNHPRRADVNQRLHELDRRIKNKEENREMSKRLAYNLNHKSHQIQKEERRMASHHGGHLTKREQNHLNHQENHLSRRIHRA